MRLFLAWLAIFVSATFSGVMTSGAISLSLNEDRTNELRKFHYYDHQSELEFRSKLAVEIIELAKDNEQKGILKVNCRILAATNKYIDPSIYSDNPARTLELEKFLLKPTELQKELEEQEYCNH